VSAKSIGLSAELHAYLMAHNGERDPVIDGLIEETRSVLPNQAGMQIAPEQAALFTFLTRLLNVRTAVEVGTFTGLSALAIARGLAPGGQLICCDISEEYTSLARRVWQRAGVADRIDLRLGPAAGTLAAMPDKPHVDLAFIDADKTGYPAYWAELVPRMNPNGVIMVDNVLRGGRVLNPGENPDDLAIVAFNDLVSNDDRVESVMLPIADGLTLARKL
jgi:caffeoyl-CoA O-methyltransferase